MRARPVNFERGQNPKRAMGIGHHWQLKKVRRKHYYQTWTEFYLYKDGKLYSKGSTQELIRANNFESDLINNPKYYRNSMEFIQAHGLNPKNVESIKESVNFERGQNPKSSMGIGHFRYENGDPIKIGDSVYLRNGAIDFPDFTGTVDSFHGEYVTVQDQADDYFDVEIHQIGRMDESVNFKRGLDPKETIGIGLGITPEWWEDNKEIYLGMKELSEKYNLKLEIIDFHAKAKVASIKAVSDANKRPVNIVLYYHKKLGPGYSKESAFEARVKQYAASWGLGFWDTLEEALKSVEKYIQNDVELNESLEFERGKDSLEGIGVGMKEKLKERSLANLVGKASNSRRIAAEIGGEFMFDTDLNKIYLLTKSGDGKFNKIHHLFDKKMWKALEPHLSEYNIKRERETGAGVDTTIYETPYGKVVREHNNIGVDQYWAEFDTYIGLLKSLNESIRFEREGTPYEKLSIGKARWKPYPRMSVQEFHDWYEQEIEPYYDKEEHFDLILDDIEDNQTLESDEELGRYWLTLGVDPELVEKLLRFRDYFMDFEYTKNLG